MKSLQAARKRINRSIQVEHPFPYLHLPLPLPPFTMLFLIINVKYLLSEVGHVIITQAEKKFISIVDGGRGTVYYVHSILDGGGGRDVSNQI